MSPEFFFYLRLAPAHRHALMHTPRAIAKKRLYLSHVFLLPSDYGN